MCLTGASLAGATTVARNPIARALKIHKPKVIQDKRPAWLRKKLVKAIRDEIKKGK